MAAQGWLERTFEESGQGVVSCDKALRGAVNHQAGAAAESSVVRDYDRRGRAVSHRRWRGQAGEIDLIAREGEGYVFVEVKKARSFDEAVLRIGRRQMDRIIAAACEFLGTVPGGMLAAMRFDVALVNARGEVRIIENAFGEA